MYKENMKCCNKGENHHKEEPEVEKKPADQFTISFSIDKFLTYALIALIIGTLVVGYSVAGNKNKTKSSVQGVNAQNTPTNSQTGDMSSHHGGGNKKFEPLPQGSVAPDFSLPSTTGKTISLADYEEKHVLLFFNPCRRKNHDTNSHRHRSKSDYRLQSIRDTILNAR